MSSDADMGAHVWRFDGGGCLSLETPRVMGILNVTPDSFSDGGLHLHVDEAARHGLALLDEGADMLDIGGESTRPGARRISDDEQIARCIPVIERLVATVDDVRISIDTTKASVARAALDAGACAVNDVAAGMEDDDMLPLVAERGVGYVLMHRLRPPDEDSFSNAYQDDERPTYDDVVEDVAAWLDARAAAAVAEGIDRERLVVDPGLGFGKTVEQNISLMNSMARFQAGEIPVLSAGSRKSFLGALAGPPSEVLAVEDRLPASLALTAMHWRAGVRLYRVHDVGAHRQVLDFLERVSPIVDEGHPKTVTGRR